MHLPLWPARLGDPVMPHGIRLGELLPHRCAKVYRQGCGRQRRSHTGRIPILGESDGLGNSSCRLCCTILLFVGSLVGEEGDQVGVEGCPGLNAEAGHERIERSIGQDVRRVEIELFAPHQAGLLALLDDGLERSGGSCPGHNACECASGWNGRGAVHPSCTPGTTGR